MWNSWSTYLNPLTISSCWFLTSMIPNERSAVSLVEDSPTHDASFAFKILFVFYHVHYDVSRCGSPSLSELELLELLECAVNIFH